MEPNLALIRETLGLESGAYLMPFSAEKRTGRQELMGMLSSFIY